MKIFPCVPSVHSKLWFLTTVSCYTVWHHWEEFAFRLLEVLNWHFKQMPLATSSPSSTGSSSPTILAAFWPFSFSTSFLTWRLKRKSSAHRAVSHVRVWDAILLCISGLATQLSSSCLVRESFTSSPAPPAIIDWTAGLQQPLPQRKG